MEAGRARLATDGGATPRSGPAVRRPPHNASLELARRIGNGAFAVLARDAQSEPLRPGRGEPYVTLDRPPMPPTRRGHILGGIYQGIAAGRASNAYGPGHQMHRDLVAQYVYGRGRRFHIARGRMPEVIAPGSSRLNFFSEAFPHVRTAMAELQARLTAAGTYTSVETDVRDSGTVSCDADKPSLGGFQCVIAGTLTAHGGGATMGWTGPTFVFTGTMTWRDRWDFDPRRPATRAEREANPNLPLNTRTAASERQTRDAHDWLPGTPFDIDSDTVPVRQEIDGPVEWSPVGP